MVEQARSRPGRPTRGAITAPRPAAPALRPRPQRAAPAMTVVIPAYNEQDGIAAVLRDVFAAIGESDEVLVVDDGSEDATYAVASSFPCRVVSHWRRQGKGAAMRTAIHLARGKNVVFIDADGSYPAAAIPEIARALAEYEMVVGSRVAGRENVPPFNRFGNAIFRGCIRLVFGFRPDDPLTGLYGLNRDRLLSMNLSSRGFGIEAEIAIKAACMGLRTSDISIEYGARIGQPKLNGLKDGFFIFLTIVRLLPRYRPWLCALPTAALLSVGAVLGLLVPPAAAWEALLP